jgi:UDP-N-acetylmuramyl pentapeptide phosphotransferase/UDP-N-acetylglucosamine-1-phosphate transferase
MDHFLPSLIASLLLSWPVYFCLRRQGVVDKPNARSSHTIPTVRGGGIAIILAMLGAITFEITTSQGREGPLLTIALAILVLAVVSFIDDLRSLRALLRFSMHGAAALSILVIVGTPDMNSIGGSPTLLTTIGTVIGFLWIAGYTNAFNFMDGINGIAGGQALVTGLATAALALVAGLDPAHPAVWLSAATAGAAAGFLPFNFPRARMFMGDVSSAPLGFLLAALGWWLVCDTAWWMLIPVGLLHANFVLDTGITLARRLLRGERWYEPHREHFYQRLVRAGRSHTEVTITEMALQVLAASCVLLAVKSDNPIGLVAVSAFIPTVWAVFFLRAERLLHYSATKSADLSERKDRQ